MGIEVIVDPSPLPWMRKGEVLRVKIRLNGRNQAGSWVQLRLDGATSLIGNTRMRAQVSQTVSINPVLHFLMRATCDGVPIVEVISQQGKFRSFVVPRSAEITEILDEDLEPLPQEEPSISTMLAPTWVKPQETAVHQTQPTNVQPMRWLMPILGTLVAILLTATGFAWWQTNRQAVVEPVESENPQDDVMPPEPEIESVADESQTQESSPAAPTATTVISTTPAEPTNCTFLNAGRPRVGESYILQCAEGQFTATGTYTVDHFVWSDYKEYPESK